MTIEERIEAAQILYIAAERRTASPIMNSIGCDSTAEMLDRCVQAKGSAWLRQQLSDKLITGDFHRLYDTNFADLPMPYDTDYADWFLEQLDVSGISGNLYVPECADAFADRKRNELTGEQPPISPNDEVFEFHIAGALQLLFEDYGATKRVTLLIEEVPVRLTKDGSFQVALGDVRKLTKARIVGEVFHLPGS